MKIYIGEEDLGDAIAKVCLKTEEYGVVTIRFYGNGYIDESFDGEDFSEPYFSPSFIRTVAFELKKKTLDYIKDEEQECFENTVWTHDPEYEDCPCKECTKKQRYKRKLQNKYSKQNKIIEKKIKMRKLRIVK